MPAQNTSMTWWSRFIFAFVAVNALLGAGSLMLFPSRTDSLFFWTIKPAINAGLFGALYLGGAIVVGWLAYRGEWEPARFLVPVLVSAGFFITLTTFLHQDRFTPGLKLGYWLVIYVGAPLLALLIYFYQERQGANWVITEPVTPATRNIAVITGTVVLLAGLLILIAPAKVQPYWSWMVSPLMLRIFASWFSAFGVGLLWFLVDHDWQRVQYIAKLMIAASLLDLSMLVLHSGDVTETGSTLWLYSAHLIGFGFIGGLMHWLQYQAFPVSQAYATE